MHCDLSTIIEQAALNKIAIATDSRNVTKGALFLAIPGVVHDGAKFVPDAVQRGAKYLICREDLAANISAKYPNLNVCGVANVRLAQAKVAAAYYHTKEEKLKIIGVTGTNGKTTTTYLLEALFTAKGSKVGVLGTINYRYPGHLEPAPLTTPDALTTHKMLAEMAKVGCSHCVMEVSSHAIDQSRIAEVPFTVCSFSNLTQDHLDFHQTMANYFAVKKRLFTDFGREDKTSVLNLDDPYGRELAKELPKICTYGLKPLQELQDLGCKLENHLQGELLSSNTQGIHLKLHYQGTSWELQTPLIGAFNASNLLATMAIGLSLGLEPKDFAPLSEFHGVPGRLERIKVPHKHIFVDYAHTPDALKNVLQALRQAGFTKIITVFGCGGNRDRQKRPLMGEMVAKYADIAVLTSDNPRYEEPQAILDDVMPGLKGAKEVQVEVDRKKATHLALNLLQDEHDCVLIAGKGHEDYQIIQGVRHHYSDQEVVREFYQCD